MRKGVVRFSVSVPPDLLERFEAVAKELGYKDRSKAIQDAMNMFLTENEWRRAKDVEVSGAVALVYDHDARGLDEYMTDVQHKFLDVILSVTHVHLTEELCLEVLSVRGSIDRVRELVRRLMPRKGVVQVKTVLVAESAHKEHRRH